MLMGLNISPAIWQSYINAILDCCKVENIVRKLWMICCRLHQQNISFYQVRRLIESTTQNGLKISPKKCQLFKTEMQYMGNTIFIKDRRVCMRPLRSGLEAIEKLRPPVTIKGCRSFVGMVNFVSISCLELQKLLKPKYDLHLGRRATNHS